MTPENHIDVLHKAILNMKNQLAVQWLFDQLTYSKELYDEQGNASPEAMTKLLDQAHKMQEQQIKSAWNDGWETATFNKCDWSENAYYEQLKTDE
jgi:hypothetical protein